MQRPSFNLKQMIKYTIKKKAIKKQNTNSLLHNSNTITMIGLYEQP
jgi:hypothetical protein